MPGAKRLVYRRDEAGRVRPRSVCHEPVIIEDFYPTILEAAGVFRVSGLAETPAGVHADGPLRQVIDGESFLPVLLGKRRTVRANGAARPLLWHHPNFWYSATPRQYNFYSALRLGRWKLIYQHTDRTFELYDLAEDLSEAHNLASQQPERVRELRGIMGRLLRARGAQMPKVKTTGETVPYPDEVEG